MAADYVVVTKTNRPQLGVQLVAAANRLRELRDLVDAIKDAKDHMNNAGNFGVFETQFGLVPAEGANVAALVDNLNTILNTATDVTGATRLANLDEFVSRVAGQ